MPGFPRPDPQRPPDRSAHVTANRGEVTFDNRTAGIHHLNDAGQVTATDIGCFGGANDRFAGFGAETVSFVR
jgi:hypothetical protein